MIYCSKCGNANAADAKFCASCGNAIGTNTFSSSNTNSNSNLKYLFIGIIAAACVATGFFLYKAFGAKDEGNATTQGSNVRVENPDGGIPNNPNDQSAESRAAEAAAAEEIAASIAARKNMPAPVAKPAAASATATTTTVNTTDAAADSGTQTVAPTTTITSNGPAQSLKDVGSTRLSETEMNMVSNVMNSYFDADNAGDISRLLQHFSYPVTRYYDMKGASTSALSQKLNAYMNDKLAYHYFTPNLESSMVTKEGDHFNVELLGNYTWETYKTPGVRRSKPVHLKFKLNSSGNITSVYE